MRPARLTADSLPDVTPGQPTARPSRAVREASSAVDQATGYISARTSEIEELLRNAPERRQRVRDSVKGARPLSSPKNMTPAGGVRVATPLPPPLPREEPANLVDTKRLPSSPNNRRRG